MPSIPRPFSARPVDRLYFYFFTHMIPIIIFADSAAFLPPSLLYPPTSTLQHIYITNFHDPLQHTQPLWFFSFAMTEFFVQLPLAIWAWFALKNDSPLAPLAAGGCSSIAAFTTWISIVEMVGNDWEKMGLGYEFGWEEKRKLAVLYGVYGLAYTIIAADMIWRIKNALVKAAATEGKKKGI